MKEVIKTRRSYRINLATEGITEGNGVAFYNEDRNLKCEFETITLAKSYLGVRSNQILRSIFKKSFIETKLGLFRGELKKYDNKKNNARARFY